MTDHQVELKLLPEPKGLSSGFSVYQGPVEVHWFQGKILANHLLQTLIKSFFAMGYEMKNDQPFLEGRVVTMAKSYD